MECVRCVRVVDLVHYYCATLRSYRRIEGRTYTTSATRVVHQIILVAFCVRGAREKRSKQQASLHGPVIPVNLDSSAQKPLDRQSNLQLFQQGPKVTTATVSCHVRGKTAAARRRREERSGSFPGISIIIIIKRTAGSHLVCTS